MASLKETRITDLRIEVSVGDLDRNEITARAYAQTRTTNGMAVVSYNENITDMISDEDKAVMEPLIRNVIERIMGDRQITVQDLHEGQQAVMQSLAEREEHEQAQKMSAAIRTDELILQMTDEQLLTRQQELARQAAEESARMTAEADAEAARVQQELDEAELAAQEGRDNIVDVGAKRA